MTRAQAMDLLSDAGWTVTCELGRITIERPGLMVQVTHGAALVQGDDPPADTLTGRPLTRLLAAVVTRSDSGSPLALRRAVRALWRSVVLGELERHMVEAEPQRDADAVLGAS